MTIMNKALWLSLLVASTASNSWAAPILDVQGGQLMGASNVEVNSMLYDVQFIDGSCFNLLNGCDETSDFQFQTLADATAASQALLDAVFLDTILGAFDSEPALTNGINDLSSGRAWTAYAGALGTGKVTIVGARNHSADTLDVVVASTTSIGADMTGTDHNAYAVWSVTGQATIPEPTTLALFSLGISYFGFVRRRYKVTESWKTKA